MHPCNFPHSKHDTSSKFSLPPHLVIFRGRNSVSNSIRILGWLHCCTSQMIGNVTLSIIEYLAHVMKIYSLTDTSRNSNFTRTDSCSKRKMKPCWKQLYFPNGRPSLLLPASVLPLEMWRGTAPQGWGRDVRMNQADMSGWATRLGASYFQSRWSFPVVLPPMGSLSGFIMDLSICSKSSMPTSNSLGNNKASYLLL